MIDLDYDQRIDRAEPTPEATPPDAEPTRESLLRALRELQASEERVRRNADRVYDESRTKLVMDILPVLDNLDRTIRAAVAEHGSPALLEGVRMVRSQLEHVLVGYGVERIDSKGTRFDPKVHEALTAVPVQNPAFVGLVLDQIEPGYRFGERLLRAAKVVVGTRPS